MLRCLPGQTAVLTVCYCCLFICRADERGSFVAHISVFLCFFNQVFQTHLGISYSHCDVCNCQLVQISLHVVMCTHLCGLHLDSSCSTNWANETSTASPHAAINKYDEMTYSPPLLNTHTDWKKQWHTEDTEDVNHSRVISLLCVSGLNSGMTRDQCTVCAYCIQTYIHRLLNNHH